MSRLFVLLLVVCVGLSASAYEFVIATGKRTPEQEEQFRLTMGVVCSFIYADRAWGLNNVYAANAHKDVFDKFIKVLEKPKYQRIAEYYRAFRGTDDAVGLEPVHIENKSKFLQLFYEGLKEAGVEEAKIKKVENAGVYEEVALQLEPALTATFGYYLERPQYPHFTISRDFDTNPKLYPAELVNRMRGLTMRAVVGNEPLVALSPYPLFLPMSAVVKAADTISVMTACENKYP